MNTKERIEVVKAMDTIARCINDEGILYNSWFVVGVADGDITENTLDEDLEYYVQDEEFKDLMTVFLKCMWKAAQSGGLYTDGIVSKERTVEWR